jgi:hypothetical protein
MIKKISVLIFLFISLSYSQVIGPKIVVNPIEYDFGTVTRGEKVKNDFLVTNTGDDLLTIIDVKASCGCTAALPEKTELEPGESTKIKVEFNSTGRSGHQVKYITVTSNDKENPAVKFKFFGNVVKEKTEDKKETSNIPKESPN